MRRDTPAARLALARRRQRAAASLQQSKDGGQEDSTKAPPSYSSSSPLQRQATEMIRQQQKMQQFKSTTTTTDSVNDDGTRTLTTIGVTTASSQAMEDSLSRSHQAAQHAREVLQQSSSLSPRVAPTTGRSTSPLVSRATAFTKSHVRPPSPRTSRGDQPSISETPPEKTAVTRPAGPTSRLMDRSRLIGGGERKGSQKVAPVVDTTSSKPKIQQFIPSSAPPRRPTTTNASVLSTVHDAKSHTTTPSAASFSTASQSRRPREDAISSSRRSPQREARPQSMPQPRPQTSISEQRSRLPSPQKRQGIRRHPVTSRPIGPATQVSTPDRQPPQGLQARSIAAQSLPQYHHTRDSSASPTRRSIVSSPRHSIAQHSSPARVVRSSPPPASTDPIRWRPPDTVLVTSRSPSGTSTSTPTKQVARSNSPSVQHLSSMLAETSSIAEAASATGPSHFTTGTPGSATRKQRQPASIASFSQQPSSASRSFHRYEGTMEDSACIYHDTLVMLRSYNTLGTIEARRPPYSEGVPLERNAEQNFFLAKQSGCGLGKDHEVLLLRKADSVDGVIKMGDFVVVASLVAGRRALGVRKNSMTGDMSVNGYEIGFFSSAIGPTEQWMVLSSLPEEEVAVGRTALAGNGRNHPSMGSVLRMGIPILLRNRYSGGILSLSSTGSVTLLTDSFSASEHSSGGMDRLQQHDRLLPTTKETFQFISVQCPPLPRWILGYDNEERIFLSGSYLLYPRRNQRSAQLEAMLFSGAPTEIIPKIAHSALSNDKKERIVMDEVLGSFLGLEGRHVRLKVMHDPTASTEGGHALDLYEFHLYNADGLSFDLSLRNLIEQILPLSTSFVRVQRFVAQHSPGYDHGKVMQAFCEALDGLIQDFVEFVLQLEQQLRHGQRNSNFLTMQNIYFEMTPWLHAMSVLERAAKAAQDKKGGELLNTVRDLDARYYMGDSEAKNVLNVLLEKASVPYMEMMASWLHSGTLSDPYEEFMVAHSAAFATTLRHRKKELDGDAWNEYFVVREQHVPQGLVSTQWTQEKLVTTGKYWNAVEACKSDQSPSQEESESSETDTSMPVFFDSSAVTSHVDSMYLRASTALMELLMGKFRLLDAMTTVKRYFLLDQGDFLIHFLDLAEEELLKPMETVSHGRIQHCVNTAIQLTESYREEQSPNSSPHPDACPLKATMLKARFAPESLGSHLDRLFSGGIIDRDPKTPSKYAYGTSDVSLSGLDAFMIDFSRVPFPLSLVFSKHTLERYQLLFRHIFFTKHVERRLIHVWQSHQAFKGLEQIRGLLGRTFLLRQRMSHFLQNFSYYMTFEVIEANWLALQSAIQQGAGRDGKQQTVDDILRLHDEFLQHTLHSCLLTNGRLLRCLTKLMNTCLLFTDQMHRFLTTTRIDEDNEKIATERRRAVQQKLNVGGMNKNKNALRRSVERSRDERILTMQRQTRRVGREVTSESYQRMVARFEEVFQADLGNFMIQLSSNTATGVMANLAIRLDYNGFVSASMRS